MKKKTRELFRNTCYSYLKTTAGKFKAACLSLLCIISGFAGAREATEPSPVQQAAFPSKVESKDIKKEAYYSFRYNISTDLARTIIVISSQEGIDPELAFRLVRTESEFKATARSPVGALGLTQLMPSTAKIIEPSLETEEDIVEPVTNLRIGFKFLRSMINSYDGNLKLALVAYNRGPGAVDRDIVAGRNPLNGYEKLVMGTHSSGKIKNYYSGVGVIKR